MFPYFTIKFYNLILNIYQNSSDLTQCENNSLMSNITSDFNSIVFSKGTIYKTKICQLVFINVNVQDIKELLIFGKINSIQENLFSNFSHLSKISLDFYFFRYLFQNGFNWLNSVNTDIDIDTQNETQIQINSNKLFSLQIVHSSDQIFYDPTFTGREMFPEQDFCIYYKFPFNRLINLISIDIFFVKNATCTIKYIMYNSAEVYSQMKQNISDCDFKNMIFSHGKKEFHKNKLMFTIKNVNHYMGVSLLIGILMSLSYLFNSQINYGIPDQEYPIEYDLSNTYFLDINETITFFLLYIFSLILDWQLVLKINIIAKLLYGDFEKNRI
ncbi:hypothetical protein BpHYR1_023606 [Brachionus plicatilis]|uniref:Transmembrane protein n=1 Tax=Brachionus plicatilis TaxID=10195 RepID=A0A3M7Q0D1_BRAPC|nr:hypothetical protein BpHYR1_023606 [Brachionus plicatilis]